MSSVDPFSQLAFYMKKQRVVNAQRNPEPPNLKQRAIVDRNPRVEHFIERIEPSKPKRKVEKWQDLIDKTAEVPKRVAVSPYREREHLSKNRVFNQLLSVASANTIVESNRQTKRNQEERPKMGRSVSAKSYDFVGAQPDRDEVKAKKIELGKARMVNEYDQHKQCWNKNTATVHDELKKGLKDNKLLHLIKHKSNDYEDPKLTKMKQIMNHHKELLKNQDLNGVLSGGNEPSEPKKRPLSPLKYKYDFQSKIDIFCRETSTHSRDSTRRVEVQRYPGEPRGSYSGVRCSPSTKTIAVTPVRKTLLDEFRAMKVAKTNF